MCLEIDEGRQRALVRKATATWKQQDQASRSTLNVALKATLKRKNNAKDDRPPKKATGSLIGEQQQKAPSPPRHGVGKGLMTEKGLIAPSPVQRLVIYKDYVVKMVTSIIKEMDLDPSGEHSLKDIGSSGLYNLSRVCPHHLSCSSPFFFILVLTIMFCSRR